MKSPFEIRLFNSEYYKKFCNWRDVAKAWYKGDELIGQFSDSNMTTPSTNILSITEYSNRVMYSYDIYKTNIDRRIESGEDISYLLDEYGIEYEYDDNLESQQGVKIAASFKYV